MKEEVASFIVAYYAAYRVVGHNNYYIMGSLNASSANYSLIPYLTYASCLDLKVLPLVPG
jgi:hypothetical protein